MSACKYLKTIKNVPMMSYWFNKYDYNKSSIK